MGAANPQAQRRPRPGWQGWSPTSIRVSQHRPVTVMGAEPATCHLGDFTHPTTACPEGQNASWSIPRSAHLPGQALPQSSCSHQHPAPAPTSSTSFPWPFSYLTHPCLLVLGLPLQSSAQRASSGFRLCPQLLEQGPAHSRGSRSRSREKHFCLVPAVRPLSSAPGRFRIGLPPGV